MKLYLTVAALIAAICFAPNLLMPLQPIATVQAQTDAALFYIEPGTTLIRDPANGAQIQGKVLINRRTGEVWGFPTATSAPYPVVASSSEPPVSKPVYLGRFDFDAMRRP